MMDSSFDDIRNILWSQTDFSPCDTKKPKNTSKKSKNVNKQTNQTKPKKQKKKKVPEHKDEDDEVEFCPPMRLGNYRGNYGYVSLESAGNIEKYERNVTNQIRQVCGMGYSNDGILHSLGYQQPQSRISIQSTDEFNANNKTPPLHEILKNRKKNTSNN